MARPNPIFIRSSVARKSKSEMRANCSAGMPRPVARIRTQTSSSVSQVRIDICPDSSIVQQVHEDLVKLARGAVNGLDLAEFLSVVIRSPN